MKNSTLFIKEKLNKLFEQFPKLKIRYEFRSSIATHLIEVLPVHYFESNHDYILFEIEIENEFEKLFGIKEDILFISSDSLNEIRDAHFALGYNETEKLFDPIGELICNSNSLNEFRDPYVPSEYLGYADIQLIATVAQKYNFDEIDSNITTDSTSYALAA